MQPPVYTPSPRQEPMHRSRYLMRYTALSLRTVDKDRLVCGAIAGTINLGTASPGRRPLTADSEVYESCDCPYRAWRTEWLPAAGGRAWQCKHRVRVGRVWPKGDHCGSDTQSVIIAKHGKHTPQTHVQHTHARTHAHARAHTHSYMRMHHVIWRGRSCADCFPPAKWVVLVLIAETVQCSAMQRSAAQRSAVQRSAVQCSAVQCSAVQRSAVQCSAVQCSARY